MPDNFPHISPIQVAAVAQFGVFTSLIEAGFTERQALIFLAEMVAAHKPDKQ